MAGKDEKDSVSDTPMDMLGPFGSLFEAQNKAMRDMMAGVFQTTGAADAGTQSALPLSQLLPTNVGSEELGEWAKAGAELQQMWLEFVTSQAQSAAQRAEEPSNLLDPRQWLMVAQSMAKQLPQSFEAPAKLAQESMQLWQGVLGNLASSFGHGAETPEPAGQTLPRTDRRFADPAWREIPAFALLHQTYLMLAEYFKQSAASIEGLDKEKKQQLEFAVEALSEALSPANFLLTNPVVMKRTVETKGQNLVRGMRHLITDLKRGQLSHTDPNAFTLGKNLASTPGKVVQRNAAVSADPVFTGDG